MLRFANVSFILIMSIFAMASSVESDEQALAASINQFNNKVLAEISKPNENFIFSPLSLHTILSLVYQGSAGDTEEALKRVLNVTGKTRTSHGCQQILSELNNVKKVRLEIANQIFADTRTNLTEQFKEVATKQFFAGAQNVDFLISRDAYKTINAWAEWKTNSKISDLISLDGFVQFDQYTSMVLVNAIYFKGRWLNGFDKRRTTTDFFYYTGNKAKAFWMMHGNGTFMYKEDKELNAQIVQMPYTNQDFSMVIVLPRQRTGLADLEKKLATYDLTMLLKDLNNTRLKLSLPNFKIESSIDLKKPLKKLGLDSAFSFSADFHHLLKNGMSWISRVYQKAVIEVNEEGERSSIETDSDESGKDLSENVTLPQEKFFANHPFVFYIINKGNAAKILLNGKIVKVHKAIDKE